MFLFSGDVRIQTIRPGTTMMLASTQERCEIQGPVGNFLETQSYFVKVGEDVRTVPMSQVKVDVGRLSECTSETNFSFLFFFKFF